MLFSPRGSGTWNTLLHYADHYLNKSFFLWKELRKKFPRNANPDKDKDSKDQIERVGALP